MKSKNSRTLRDLDEESEAGPEGRNHQTRLLYKSTWRVDSANRLFGNCYNGNTILIINPGRSPLKPYIRVPEGVYALVQHHGSDVDYVNPDGSRTCAWPPGFHWASLFTKVAHLVTKQYVVFNTPVKGCKTADDVTVRIDMTLVFRIMGDASKGEDPELVRRFVYELGPNGLEVQLRAAQEEAARALARSVQHTEVYKLRDGTLRDDFHTGQLKFLDRGTNLQDILQRTDPATGKTIPSPMDKSVYYVTEDIKKNLNKQFNTYGVQITSVAITYVKLPDNFQEQMQSKTTHLSEIKEQDMKQLSDMQMLQYKEEIDTTKLERKMMLMEAEQTGKAKCAEIQKEIDLIVADTKLVDSQIQQDTRVKCSTIQAEARLKIEGVKADAEKIAAETAAQCETEIEMLRAEKEALAMQLKAHVDEILRSGEAKANEIVATAEGESATKLGQYRAHLLEMQRLDVISALAQNKKTVISGDTSNSLLSEMVAVNRQGQLLLNVGESELKGLMKPAPRLI